MLCFYCASFIFSLVFHISAWFFTFCTYFADHFYVRCVFLWWYSPLECKSSAMFFFLFQMTSGASYFLVAMKISDCKWAQIMSLWSNYIHYSENKVHIIDPMVKGGCKKAGFFHSREPFVWFSLLYSFFKEVVSSHFSSECFPNYTCVPTRKWRTSLKMKNLD